jgi:TolB protein
MKYIALLSLMACASPETETLQEVEGADGSDLSGVLLFSEVYDGTSMQMWSYAFEDESVVELSSADNVYWFGRWSPDATRIGLSRHTDIYVMDSDGLNIRKVTGGQGQQIHPAWDPEGRRLVYQAHAKPDYEIAVIDVDEDGQQIHVITENEQNDYTPDWSPSGEFIVMVRDIGIEKQLIRYDVATGEEQQITDLAGDCERPRISPDSSKIAFQRSLNGFVAIYFMEADGSGEPTALTESQYNLMPAWSPDGRYISYISDKDGFTDVFVMNLQGRQVAKLTDNYFEERDLDWRD